MAAHECTPLRVAVLAQSGPRREAAMPDTLIEQGVKVLDHLAYRGKTP